ncbi:hypothetical protein LINGRAHAP2_LOCUS10294 [Linum grandiflorum]
MPELMSPPLLRHPPSFSTRRLLTMSPTTLESRSLGEV